jgi:hypothetical protein
MKCRQMLRCTAIYTNSSCKPLARLSGPGSASYPRSHVTAKTRNSYMPRFVFYRKKRLSITKKRVFIIKDENAQHCIRPTI